MKKLYVLFVLALLFALLVPLVAVAAENEDAPEARTVRFRPYCTPWHARYNSAGRYIGWALGSGSCTPVGGGLCKARNAYGSVFYVKYGKAPGLVVW